MAASINQGRRPIILVLGMHRSGTSLCSHMLSVLGADMADVITPGGGNDNGHWERWEIVAYHDRILELFNRAWASPTHDLPLPPAWWADPQVTAIRRDLTHFVEQRMDKSLFGFKDPRTVRLLPLWHQICEDLHLAPKIILCLRNPAHIGRSLHARDGLNPAIGEYRWLVHMMDFLRYTGGAEYCLIEYEKWFDDPHGNVARLQNFLGLSWQQSQSDLDVVLSTVIDSRLRHDEPGQATLPMVRTVYDLFLRSERDLGARQALGEIAAQFVNFQQLQQPLQHTFEKAVIDAAELSERDQKLDALRKQLAETEAAGKAALAVLEQTKSALEKGQLEAAEQRTQQEGRQAELVAALEKALSEAEAHRMQLDSRESELNHALKQAKAEVEDSRMRLRQHETDLLAAREKSETLARAERNLVDVRGMLADKDRALVESRQELARLQTAEKRVIELSTALAERDRAAADARQKIAELQHVEQKTEELAAMEADNARLAAQLEDLRFAISERDALLKENSAREEEYRAALASLGADHDEQVALADDLRAAVANQDSILAKTQQRALQDAQKFSSLRAQYDEQTSLIADLQSQNLQDADRLANAIAESDALTAQLAERDRALADTGRRALETERELDVLAAQLAEQDRVLADTTQSAVDAKRESTALTVQLARLDQALADTTKRGMEAERKFAALEAEQQQLIASLTHAEQDRDENWVALSTARQQIAHYEATRLENEAEIELYIRDLAAAHSEKDETEARLAIAFLKGGEMAAALGDAQRDRDRSARALESTRSWATGLRKQVQANRIALAETEAQAMQDARNLVSALEEIETLKNELAVNEAERDEDAIAVQSLLAQAREELDAMALTLSEKDAAQDRAQSDIVGLRKGFNQRGADLQRALAEAAALKASYADYDQARDKLVKENALLQEQLAAARRVSRDIVSALRAEQPAPPPAALPAPAGLLARLRTLLAGT